MLLTALLLLRRAVAPAILIAIAIIPTLLFSRTARRAFQRAYDDAGLKQTSQLDGWDTLQATSQGQREEYRKWLVDCHKASYVPICLAGSDCPLTVEPSVVTEDDRDDIDDNRRYLMRRHHEQRGAFYRRGC